MPSVSSLQNATIPLPEVNAAARKLPAVCPDCGWATQIRVDYTRLECTNPYCTAKIVERAYKLTRYCGVETLTWDDVNSHVRSLNVKNPLRLLDTMSRQKLPDLIIASPRLVLPNYVTAAFLPHVGRSEARALFAPEQTLEEAYEGVLTGGVGYIKNKLAIPDDTYSSRAGRIYESLLEYKTTLEDTKHLIESSRK